MPQPRLAEITELTPSPIEFLRTTINASLATTPTAITVFA
jgi:hypothetical protein